VLFAFDGNEYTALMTENRVIAHVTARYPPLYCRYRIKRFNLIIRALIGRWQNNFLLIAISGPLVAPLAIENCIPMMAPDQESGVCSSHFSESPGNGCFRKKEKKTG
jgi:hypothetical protein